MKYYVLLCEGSLGGRQGQARIGLDEVVTLDNLDGPRSWLPVFRSKETARAFIRTCLAIDKPPEEAPLAMNRADLSKLAGEMRKRGLADSILFDPYVTPAWDLECPSKPASIKRFCRRAKRRR